MVPTELQTRLEGEVLEVEFEALQPHVAREAVLWVQDDLPLVKAAMAVSLDAIDDVKDWMARGLLTKLGPERTRSWDSQRRFRFLIVQPFVLVQAVPAD